MKIQQLKERIYALNPELKALTMGCKVLIFGAKLRTVVDVVGTDVIVDRYPNTHFCKEEYEILGHPIHLEHVLRAMKDQPIIIDSTGTFGYVSDGSYDLSDYPTYDLSKTFDQNIADNSELVDFLLEIIK